MFADRCAGRETGVGPSRSLKLPAMRLAPLLLAPLLLLAACRGTQSYTPLDLSQVKQAYSELLPTYTNFKRYYTTSDTAGILKYYRLERSQCRLVDQIDSRDTIDPNVNLFQASIGLDNICNAIESAYTSWAIQHHYPYIKKVVPARPFEAFIGSDQSVAQMPLFLKNPGHLGQTEQAG